MIDTLPTRCFRQMNRSVESSVRLCALLLAVFGIAPAQADIYAMESDDGTLHLTDAPVGDGYTRLIDSSSGNAGASLQSPALPAKPHRTSSALHAWHIRPESKPVR